MEINISEIQNLIYLIRGQKVMLDSDLASLYGVETKYLNRQVRRNVERFPGDFMFQLNVKEYELLKCQIGTSKEGRGGKQKLPLVFTECGIAMLSSILRSKKAALVNISNMRIFVKLRSYHLMENDFNLQFSELKQSTDHLFKVVFERLDKLETGLPDLSIKRKKLV